MLKNEESVDQAGGARPYPVAGAGIDREVRCPRGPFLQGIHVV